MAIKGVGSRGWFWGPNSIHVVHVNVFVLNKSFVICHCRGFCHMPCVDPERFVRDNSDIVFLFEFYFILVD